MQLNQNPIFRAMTLARLYGYSWKEYLIGLENFISDPKPVFLDWRILSRGNGLDSKNPGYARTTQEHFDAFEWHVGFSFQSKTDEYLKDAAIFNGPPIADFARAEIKRRSSL